MSTATATTADEAFRVSDNVALWSGASYPLGATFDGSGTNFAIFSERAERVELCLFDERRRESRVTLPEITAFVHHG